MSRPTPKFIGSSWKRSTGYDLPLKRKLEGTFHLGANLAFPAALFMTVVTLPVMLLRMGTGAGGTFAQVVDSLVFLLVIVTQVGFYVVATRESHEDWIRRLRYLPFFPLIGAGLAVNNARGVLEAFSGLKTEFVRTPKLGVLGEDRALVKKRERAYTGGRDFWQAIVEILLGVYYVCMAVVQGLTLPVGAIVTLVLSAGLFTMGGATLRALAIRRGRQTEQAVAETVPALNT